MARLTKSEIARIRRLKTVAMRRAFLQSWTGIKDRVVLADLVRMIETGNVSGALSVINLQRAQLAPIEGALADAYATAGIRTAGVVNKVTRAGVQVSFGFNARAPRAEQWLSRYGAQLIGDILRDQERMVREVMVNALATGVNPRRTALELVGTYNRAAGHRTGGLIGLSNNQFHFVQNMREELGRPDGLARYFTRSRRDARYDGIVRRAMEEGRALSPAEIDLLTTRYADRLLQTRGETVARTETLTALRAGQQEAIVQAMEEEDVQPQEAKKVWSSSGDSRTRDDHEEMDGQEQPIDQPFEAPDGSLLMFPGDTSMGADASQTINCRCISEIQVDFIGRSLRMEGF